MHVPSILPDALTPPKAKKRRNPLSKPVMAGVAGGAIALMAYKKTRGGSPDASDDEEQAATPATGETNELRRHVSDMVALDREMAASFRRQLDGEIADAVPDARGHLEAAVEAFETQAEALEDEFGSEGGGPSAIMKKLLAMTGGAVAPILGGGRSEPVSRTLRDDVVGLHLAAASSAMLEAAATSAGDSAVVAIAVRGGEQFGRLASDLEAVLPAAVTKEFEARQAPSPDVASAAADDSPLAQPSQAAQMTNAAIDGVSPL